MAKKLTIILAAAALLLNLGGCGTVRRVLDKVLPGHTVATSDDARLTDTNKPTTDPGGQPSALPASRQEILDAFRAIAFNSEYGSPTNSIRKWSVPIRAAIHGKPTEEDLAALNRAMDGLNGIDGFPGISVEDTRQNMDIWFIPLDEMKDVIPGYVEGNWGFFSVSADGQGLSSATVAIATDVTKQNERNHLIFEEVLQSTGLMQDWDKYPDSIFYSAWTTVQQPTGLDWQLLKLLYNPAIRHGMGEKEAMEIIAALPPLGQQGSAKPVPGWSAYRMAIMQYIHAC